MQKSGMIAMYRSASDLFVYKTESAIYVYILNNIPMCKPFLHLYVLQFHLINIHFYGICTGRKKKVKL